MSMTTTTPQKLIRRTDPTPTPGEEQAGLWGYRLGQALVLTLFLSVVAVALAVGLGWTTWDRIEALAPILHRVAASVWGLSLLGLILTVIALSEYGPKRRSLIALLLHALLAIGPVIAMLLT